ncbi:MAG: SRPBCC domain-containing protein [Actinomycetota bacterium]
MLGILRGRKDLRFERTYPADREAVWRAWTDPELLRRWWGPEGTTVTACEIDLRIGGTISVVTEAGETMGKYAGTRWPMEGTFGRIEEPGRLVYDARSWTEGEEAGSTIEHTNDLRLRADGAATQLTLHVAITSIGPKAKMAAFGMKWGYKAQLDALGEVLT